MKCSGQAAHVVSRHRKGEDLVVAVGSQYHSRVHRPPCLPALKLPIRTRLLTRDPNLMDTIVEERALENGVIWGADGITVLGASSDWSVPHMSRGWYAIASATTTRQSLGPCVSARYKRGNVGVCGLISRCCVREPEFYPIKSNPSCSATSQAAEQLSSTVG